MKRFFSIWLVSVMLAVTVLAGGCGRDIQGGARTKGAAGSITIAGSTSIQPFSEVLAEEYMAENPGTRINVQGGGSTQGIVSVKTGVADIGASSRELKPEEKGLHEFVIARDGIAVIVNPRNKVSNLSMQQLKDIFSGKITSWKDVGETDAPITLVSREAGSGTRDGFENLVMQKTSITNKALVCNSNGAVRYVVAGDPNAIGYISMANVDESVKMISVDGVPCTAETILQGRYKISRPFIYLTRKEPRGLARSYIDFVLSQRGQEILKNEGVVPVKPVASGQGVGD